MKITQSVVNETHRRHLQQEFRDVDGSPFIDCKCGRMFDSRAEATMHWWRAARALQRHAKG